MKQGTIELIKKKLEAERAALLDQLKSTSGPTPDEADGRAARFPNYGDSNEENASEVSDFSASLPVEKQIEASLIAIETALGRIADTTYGSCEVCRQPIDEERLIAMPTARTCLDHTAR